MGIWALSVPKPFANTLLGRHAVEEVPGLRTIGRVLVRNGLLDRHVRVRRAAPPPGWYLPAVAAGEAPLDAST